MKKFILSLLLLFSLVALAGCNQDKPDQPNDPDKVWTSDTYDWKTPQTDSLKLTQQYAGKDFIKDGIGVMKKVVRFVDGDTTVFQSASGEQITVRYNGINTPESTYRIEPWGFAASRYVKAAYDEAIKAGAKIVLQTEDMDERVDSTGQRYLAWIWFVYPSGDSRLLNLELAELGYAQVKSASGTQYGKVFTDAIFDITIKKLRVYGEKDPTYDYSTEAKEMTIKEIREQYGNEEAVNNSSSEFSSPLIKVSGVVVRNNGQTNAYIQQYDAETGKYYGIYVYGGYNSISSLIVGAYVQITARVGYYYGSLQITDLTADSKIHVYSFNAHDQIVPVEEEVDDINNIYAYEKLGTLVTLHNITVNRYRDSDNNSATTLYCTYVNANGKTKEINIRVDQSVALIDPITGEQILTGAYFSGKTFESITGIVCYYNGDPDYPVYAEGHIQIALCDMNDVVFA